MNDTRILPSWPIRKKVLILLLVLFLPAFGLILASGLNYRTHEIERAEKDALLLVESVAAQQEQIASGIRQILSTLAKLPEVQSFDVYACNKLFHDLCNRYPYYSAIGAVTVDGSLFANYPQFELGSINLSDRKHIKDVIKTLDFSVGEYIIGRVSKVQSINYTYPVLDTNNNLIAVVIAGFKLDEYYRFMAKVQLPEGFSLTVLDHRGVRLFRVPKHDLIAVGKPIPASSFKRISGNSKQGIVERTGQDGVNRIYAFKQLRLREDQPPYLYVTVGIPKTQIIHKANLELLRNLSALGFLTFIVMSIAWFIGDSVFIKPINRLVTAIRRFGNGEMDARTNLLHTPDELGQLAKSFDEMASLLETRIIESKNAEDALRESEEKYRALIETTETGYVITDPKGKVLDANAEYVRLAGHSTLQEILGKNVIDWTAAHDLDRNAEEVERCAENGFTRNLEIDYVNSRGEVTPLEINATSIRTAEGTLILSLCRDISNRKRMEDELVKAKKLEATGILAGGIAHDFNNLLTIILGNIDMAKDDMESGTPLFQLLTNAKKAALQASNLTEKFMTFSMGAAPQIESVSIKELIMDSATLALSDSNMECRYHFSDDLWLARVDQSQMGQSLYNVIVNAKEATPQEWCLDISAENMKIRSENGGLPLKAGRYVKITVRDYGIGIPEDVLDKIFDPYYSTKDRGSQKGMGMGLTIAHSIVIKHGGHITVESKIREGTSICIYLPACKAAPKN